MAQPGCNWSAFQKGLRLSVRPSCESGLKTCSGRQLLEEFPRPHPHCFGPSKATRQNRHLAFEIVDEVTATPPRRGGTQLPRPGARPETPRRAVEEDHAGHSCRRQNNCFLQPRALYFFKVAILTLKFNISSSNRVEGQRSEARGISPNLTYHNHAPCRSPRLVSHLGLASLSLRSAVAKPDALFGGRFRAAEK